VVEGRGSLIHGCEQAFTIRVAWRNSFVCTFSKAFICGELKVPLDLRLDFWLDSTVEDFVEIFLIEAGGLTIDVADAFKFMI